MVDLRCIPESHPSRGLVPRCRAPPDSQSIFVIESTHLIGSTHLDHAEEYAMPMAHRLMWYLDSHDVPYEVVHH